MGEICVVIPNSLPPTRIIDPLTIQLVLLLELLETRAQSRRIRNNPLKPKDGLNGPPRAFVAGEVSTDRRD
jgi:hypothetical protein